VTARRVKIDIRQASRPILLVLLAWLLLSLGFFLFWTRPKVQAYRALMRDSEPQRTALDERRRTVERNETFLAALQKAENDLLYLRREVLSTRKERLVDVQRELAKLCRDFHIALDSVTFSNDLLEDEEVDRMAMVVPLEGGYDSLREFLHAVENSAKFLLVEQVALGEGKQGGVILQLDITLTTYFDLPPEMKSKKPTRRTRPNRRA
jgi:Tfp pilus assembly protein PilO